MKKSAKTKRNLADVNNEYSLTCAYIGDKEHKIGIFEREIDQHKSRLRALDIEADFLRKTKPDGQMVESISTT